MKHFKYYNIDVDNLTLPEKRENESIEHLMKNFDPTTDAIDKRILYEITGKKGANERYSDDEGSSDDED